MDRTDSEDDKRDSVVIVALPSEMDKRVYDVSSEKKPHLTILFLGEADFGGESAAVVQFIEHAAKTSLRRFGLSVTRRGVLGDEGADVLFFDKDFLTEEIKDFRAALLGNPHISTAYNAAEQYPEWIPHLTLGYPDAPAAEDDSDYGMSWINFDRIAVWFGDSEGPEFLLSEDRSMEVAMSDGAITTEKLLAAEVDFSKINAENITPGKIDVNQILAHYGVKGMKWGVRRTQAQLESASEEGAKVESIRSRASTSGTNALSNSELRTAIDRMNLEQQYSQLVAKTTPVSPAKKFVRSLLGDIGQSEVRRVAKGAASLQVEKALRAQGQDDLAKRIQPKKK